MTFEDMRWLEKSKGTKRPLTAEELQAEERNRFEWLVEYEAGEVDEAPKTTDAQKWADAKAWVVGEQEMLVKDLAREALWDAYYAISDKARATKRFLTAEERAEQARLYALLSGGIPDDEDED